MALTSAALATALGIDDGPEAVRLLAVAGELVTAHLRGSTSCPVEIRDEATIRTAGHLMNRSGYGKADSVKVGTLALKLVTAASPIRQSGAGAILSPFVKRSA